MVAGRRRSIRLTLALGWTVSILAFSVDPSDPVIQYTGRWNFNDRSAPAFQWPGASISFILRCSSASNLSARFKTHDTYTKFGIYLTDETNRSNRTTPLPYQLVPAGEATLAATLPSGATTVSIVKLSEDFKADPAQGSKSMLQPPCTFHGLSFDGSTCNISQSSRRKRAMQFIGDSITCGFGNQPANPLQIAECTSEAAITSSTNIIGKALYQFEDIYESWSMQLARLFNADAQVQCLSGIGMCKNGIGLQPHSPYNMTYFVDRTLPFTEPVHTNMWNYSQFRPDVLVINLGTNDYIASTGPTAPGYQEFQDHYVRFVHHIMGNYDAAKTKVLLACGPMTSRQCPYVEAAGKLLAQDFHLGYVNVSLGCVAGVCGGCAGHPTQTGDTHMVDLLVPMVQKLTGW